MLDRSPFPGMDPYLEAHWGDVHHGLITYARDQLQSKLPAGLRARMEERVFVETPAGQERSIYPDVRVVERGKARSGLRRGNGVAVAEPLLIPLPADEPATEGFIEIIDAATGGRILTVIEFLSPANKVIGSGRDLYQRKQRQLREGNVSLVEIDLVRAGKHVLVVPLRRIPAHRQTTYLACVLRAWKPEVAEVYPISLRGALPTIKIPLRQTDADVTLDLQSLLDLAYRNGRYDDINYRKAPTPALDRANAAWAAQLLKKQGLR